SDYMEDEKINQRVLLLLLCYAFNRNYYGNESVMEEAKFKLHSKYKPSEDQPTAIKDIVEGIRKGEKEITLLGATGTGKTFTMSNVIEQVNKPTLVIAHNKTLAG